MKILAVHPGASVSTHDVFVGLTEGLRAHGHTVYQYALDGRIARSSRWLDHCWRKGNKTLPRPTQADILYHAGEELVARSLRIHTEEAPLDSVLVISAMFLHPDVFVLMKRAHLPVDLLFTESPYDDERQVRVRPFVRLAWTNERSSTTALDASYLPHAYRAEAHAPGAGTPNVPAHDVVFVGTAFKERIEMLEAVDWTGIDLGLYGAWDLLGSRNPLRRFLRDGYISNERTAALYRRAKIGLNLYRQSKGFAPDSPRVTTAESMNPRAYELAATGCFTLSEQRAEVSELLGDLVPTFSNGKELGQLIRHWLADEASRARIRGLLPSRVATHTWDDRASRIERDLQSVGIVASSATSGDRLVAAAGG